jgi:hypothetical protein
MLDTDKDGVLSNPELAVAMKGMRMFAPSGASAGVTPAPAAVKN